MAKSIGVLATRRLWIALVEDNRIVGEMRVASREGGAQGFRELPADALADAIREQILIVAAGHEINSIGVAFPGIIHDGIVQECPNMQQMKGSRLAESLSDIAPAFVLNDTDAMAAGVAASRDQLEKLIRVWYLGEGIGFGHYPPGEAFWEAGHSVVTLDPKERYCGCGGAGHLEGIMGRRAMRKRFLDKEPDEIFTDARTGDQRCVDFVKLFHRALAAASATSIALVGPGKFFLTGPSTAFVDLALLGLYLHDMITMSTLQGSQFEIIEGDHELAVIGAAVHAGQNH